MEFKKLMASRYSCRCYTDQAVDDQTIRELAALAQRAPSWGNTQPGRIYAAQGEKASAIRAGLVAAVRAEQPENPEVVMPATFEGPLMDRYRQLGRSLFAVLGIGRGDHDKRGAHYANNYNAFGAPCLVYFTIPAGQTPYVVMDTGAMITAFCLAAADARLGTCIIAALARYPDEVRRHLTIPDNEKILMGVALGHPDEAAEVNQFRSKRAELDQVLTIFG